MGDTLTMNVLKNDEKTVMREGQVLRLTVSASQI